jgi:hypothetical protein
MRFASMICLTLSISGCSQSGGTQRSPTAPSSPAAATPPMPAPPPQSSNLVVLWGYVVTPSGECIEGATVEVVAGPVLVGQKATQKTPCDSVRLTGGFWFDDAVPCCAEMTLRASSPGYVSRAQTIIPYSETIDRTLTLVPSGR